MRAPKPPATPDPYAVASAQQVANVEVAIANTALANADEDRPDATVRFSATADTITANTYDSSGVVTGTRTFNRWKKVVTLTDEAQTQYDQQQDIAIALNSWALAQIGLLQTTQGIPFSLSLLTARIEAPDAAVLDDSVSTPGALTLAIGATDLTTHLATVRDSIDARLQYQIGIDRTNRIDTLAHQGIVPGMSAYERDLDTFDKQSTDARIQSYLAAGQEQTRIVQLEATVGQFKNQSVGQAFELSEAVIDNRNKRKVAKYQALRDAAEYIATQRQQEMQEELTERSVNMNEISSLMHGGQISVPQFQPFQHGAISQTPVADSVYRSHASDMEKWQAKVQNQQAMMGAIAGLAGNMIGGGIGMGWGG